MAFGRTAAAHIGLVLLTFIGKCGAVPVVMLQEGCGGAIPYSSIEDGVETCVTECPPGQAPDPSDACTDCPLDKYANHLSHECVDVCPDGLVSNEDTRDCTDPCASKPYKDNNGACVAECPRGQVPTPNPEGTEKTCSRCPDGMFADMNKMECTAECPRGTAPDLDGRLCGDVLCLIPTPYKNEDGECVEHCPAGQIPKEVAGSDNNACASCQADEYVDSSLQECVSECPKGTTPNEESRLCEDPCAGKPFVDASGKCVERCPAGHAKRGGVGHESNTCVACENIPGSGQLYADHHTSECVDICPEGFVPNRETNDCERDGCGEAKPYKGEGNTCVAVCPSGHAPNGQQICEACDDDKFADHDAHSCVNSCPDGTTANDATNNCDKDLSSDILACPAEAPYKNPQGQCVDECPAGTAPGVHLIDTNDCTVCGDGQFADHKIHSCVEDCGPGFVGNAETSDCEPDPCADKPYEDSSGQCVEVCGAGEAPDRDSKVCAPCANATYANHVDHVCVSECPEGYTPDNATMDCITDPCTGKPFKAGGAEPGTTSLCLDECPPGQIPDASLTCNPCPEEQYAHRAAKECVFSCPDGTIKDETNKECIADICAGKPFRDDTGECIEQCPPGQTAGETAQESGRCTPCPEDSYANHETQVCDDRCPEGTIPNPDTRNCDTEEQRAPAVSIIHGEIVQRHQPSIARYK